MNVVATVVSPTMKHRPTSVNGPIVSRTTVFGLLMVAPAVSTFLFHVTAGRLALPFSPGLPSTPCLPSLPSLPSDALFAFFAFGALFAFGPAGGAGFAFGPVSPFAP